MADEKLKTLILTFYLLINNIMKNKIIIILENIFFAIRDYFESDNLKLKLQNIELLLYRFLWLLLLCKLIFSLFI